MTLTNRQPFTHLVDNRLLDALSAPATDGRVEWMVSLIRRVSVRSRRVVIASSSQFSHKGRDDNEDAPLGGGP